MELGVLGWVDFIATMQRGEGERYFDIPAGKWDCPGIVKGVVVCCMAYCCSLVN